MTDNLHEITFSFDLFIKWEKDPPIYRVYIDDELLVERSYIWQNPDEYINENLVLLLAPGKHEFKVKLFPDRNDIEVVDTNIKINGVLANMHSGFEFTI